MKIVGLEVSNIKRVSAVDIDPDKNFVVIGGNNAQGKSSVLDSITYALCGKRSLPDDPIKHGKRKAEIVVDMDDIVVKRTFSGSGTKLKVTSKNGSVSSPQKILDGLIGKLSFDPLSFAKMDSKKQLEQLKKLVGLDFEDLDIDRQALYEERALVNRELKAYELQLEQMAYPQPGTPAEEVDVVGLSKKLRHQQAENSKIEELERLVKHLDAEEKRMHEEILRIEAKKSSVLSELGQMERSDEDGTMGQIEKAEETNRNVRLSRKRSEVRAGIHREKEASDSLTERIKDIDNKKRLRMESARFPISGLSFSDDGVIYNGVPFNQASESEKLKVSIAIGMAMNPNLRVLIVKDAALLDSQSLNMIKELAGDNDFQIWLERVGEGEECSVIIEDGSVK